MLNPFLYRALEEVFGTVLVENGGVHGDIRHDLSRGYVTGWSFADDGVHGEQYRVNCPFCGDRKHHLYISYLSYARPVVDGVELMQGPLMAHCFRCGSMSDPSSRSQLEGMIAMGMSAVGDPDGGKVDMSAWSDIQDSHAPPAQSAALTLEGIRTWSPGYTSCLDGMPSDIEGYLRERGVDESKMRDFSVGWGPVQMPRSGKLLSGGKPWVQFPIVMNGELRGIQARCPDKYMQPGDSMKYWIHPGMRKNMVVYNLDRARDLGLAVVCEGVFDAMSVGAPGVCCFGHVPSMTQKRLLTSVGNCVILLPDTDWHEDFNAVAEAEDLAVELNMQGVLSFGAHVVKLPAKDAGDMSRQSVWLSILEQVPPSVQDYVLGRVVSRL